MKNWLAPMNGCRFLYRTRMGLSEVLKELGCFRLRSTKMLYHSTDSDGIRWFTCKKLRYIWNESAKEFVKIPSLGPGLPLMSLHRPSAQQGIGGLNGVEQLRRQATVHCYCTQLLDMLRLILRFLKWENLTDGQCTATISSECQ